MKHVRPVMLAMQVVGAVQALAPAISFAQIGPVGGSGAAGSAGGGLSGTYPNPSVVVSTGIVSGTAGVAANALDHLSFAPGLLTAVNTTKASFNKIGNASVLDNLEVTALTAVCTTTPQIAVFECGTSVSCAGAVTLATALMTTTAGIVVDGTISTSNIAAGDYIAFAISTGACSVLDMSATIQLHQK